MKIIEKCKRPQETLFQSQPEAELLETARKPDLKKLTEEVDHILPEIIAKYPSIPMSTRLDLCFWKVMAFG